VGLTLFILVSTTIAGYFDLRWHRVPNWLVGLTVTLSLAWHTSVSGPSGLWRSLAGLLLALGLLFPLFLVRGMGAGDVKFFGALGAALTYPHLLAVLTISFLVAAVMAVHVVLRRGAAKRTLRNLLDLGERLLHGRIGHHPVVQIDNPAALVVPFTLAQAVATWIFVLSHPGGWH
jgi:prepilin peptidase CpaA